MIASRHTAGLARAGAFAALVAMAAAQDNAPAPAPAPPPVMAPAADGRVNFSFDDADIRLLVKLVAETTGRRMVVDDKVTGRITVVSPAPVPVAELFPLLVNLLEARGFSIVEREGVSYVIPLPERPTPGAPLQQTGGPPVSGVVTRILPIRHVSAGDLAQMLEPLVRGGKTGGIAAFGPSNHLILTDTTANLDRLAAIIAEVDQPGASRAIEVVILKHASAEDLAQQVSAAVKGSEKAGARVSRHLQQVAEGSASLPGDSLVIASSQANALLLVGSTVQLQEMKRVIGLLDVEPSQGQGRFSAIFLKYLQAEEASKSINALLAKTVAKDQNARVAIEANVANNALLVDASPRDYQWIEELVRKLDQPQQQVMVEVVIAEVNLGKRFDFGVSWSTVETPGDGKNAFVGRSRPGETDSVMDAIAKGVFPQGIAIGVAHGTESGVPRIPFLLEALKDDRDVNILSSVPLWAQNNQPATVNVVENIPILKSTIEGGSGTSRDVIQNIDRMDVGIKLKVTPHVNPDKIITLNLNPSIEAVIDQGSSEVQFTPTIAKRDVSTTVTVPDGTTVVISGLIREDKSKRVYKVPLLGDIPLLGYLFRYTSDRKQRTNLMVFVTPTIVSDPEKSAELKKRYEERFDGTAPITDLPVGRASETNATGRAKRK